MTLDSALSPARDRRVRRSRTALMNASVALVSERGYSAVALSDIAEAADVGRKVAYQQFGDRDTLLLEAAIDLLRRELLPQTVALPPGRERAVASARHFAEHRSFYRAMLTCSTASPLSAAVVELFLPRTRDRIEFLYGDDLGTQFVTDLATQLHGGMVAMLTAWLIDGEDPLDAEAFADRLLRVQYFLVPEGKRDDANSASGTDARAR
jgi:AcrR family transcriptional regulator